MKSEITGRIAQVRFVYFFTLTLTFIFKNKLLAFYLICEYLVNSWTCEWCEPGHTSLLPSNIKSHILTYLPSNGAIANDVHRDLDLHFEGQQF